MSIKKLCILTLIALNLSAWTYAAKNAECTAYPRLHAKSIPTSITDKIADSDRIKYFTKPVSNTKHTYAILTQDGRVYSWFMNDEVIPPEAIAKTIENNTFSKVVASTYGFAALTDQGELVSWGISGDERVSDSLKAYAQLLKEKKVVELKSGARGFIALTDTGHVIYWGSVNSYPKSRDKVTNVLEGRQFTQIATTERWLTALDAQGKTVTWNFFGLFERHDRIKYNQSRLDDVTIKKIHSNKEYFFGITADKKIIQWPDNNYGFRDSGAENKNTTPGISTPYALSPTDGAELPPPLTVEIVNNLNPVDSVS